MKQSLRIRKFDRLFIPAILGVVLAFGLFPLTADAADSLRLLYLSGNWKIGETVTLQVSAGCGTTNCIASQNYFDFDVPLVITVINPAGTAKEIDRTLVLPAKQTAIRYPLKLSVENNFAVGGSYLVKAESQDGKMRDELSRSVSGSGGAGPGAEVDPAEINISVQHGMAELPVYKFVKNGSNNPVIQLQVLLNSPNRIHKGDTMSMNWEIDPTFNGTYLGLMADANFAGCKLENVYTSCDFVYGKNDIGRGFGIINQLNQGRAQGVSIRLSYEDVIALGARPPLTSVNPQDKGMFKDVYFIPTLDFQPGWRGASYTFTGKGMALPDAVLAVRLYAFETQADADKANTTGQGLSVGNSGGLTQAQSIKESDKGALGVVISILNVIIGFLAGLLRWIIWILGYYIFLPIVDTVLQMDASHLTKGPVLEAWTYVRDIVNMFFILGLIVIGFGTMLKLESYSYKKLLVNLILMALLVNFSLVIGRIIIQIADAVQFTFLSPGEGVNSVKTLFQNLTVGHVSAMLDGIRGFSASSSEALGATFTIIMQLILELGVVFTFGALAVFLLIRTVALWVLLVISPFAYALAILPATASLAKKWWTNFIKYAMFTPVIAFFLRLTTVFHEKIVTMFPENSFFGTTSSEINITMYIEELSQHGSESRFKAALALGVMYAVILAFMWAGLYVTKSLGIFGAGAIVGLAEKGLKAPFAGGAWLGKRGIGRAGRWWNDKTTKWVIGERDKIGKGRSALFALLNPKATWKGWEARSKDLQESSQKKAEAAGLQVVEQRLTFGKKVIPRVKQHEKAEEDEFVKQFAELTREEQISMADHIRDMEGDEGARMKRALTKVAMANGYVDDLVTDTDLNMKKRMAEVTGDKRYMDVNSDLYYKKDGKDVLKYNQDTRRAFYKAFLGEGKKGELGQSALRMIAQDGAKYGKNTKHWEYLEDSYFDYKQDKFVERPTEEDHPENGEAYAASELAKQASREQAGVAHHSLMDLSDDGEIDTHKFRVFSTAATENPGFMQERTAHYMLHGGGELEVDMEGNLVIDPASLARIQNMMQVSPEAVAVMYQRLMKQDTSKSGIAARMGAGFNIKVRGEDGERHVRLDRKAVTDGRGSNAAAAPQSARPHNPSAGAGASQPPANPPTGGWPRGTVLGPDGRPVAGPGANP